MHKFVAKITSVLCALTIITCISADAHASTRENYLTESPDLVESSAISEHGIKTEFKLSFGSTESVVVQMVKNRKPAATPNIFLPNWIIGSITPQSSSYLITFTNVGADTVDSLSMKLTVKKG